MFIAGIVSIIGHGRIHPGYFFLITTILLMGFLQTFFIGLIGEYLIYVNIRVINRPMVVEEKRFNLPRIQSTAAGRDEASRL